MSDINGRGVAGRLSERLSKAILEPLEERLLLSHVWQIATAAVSMSPQTAYLEGVCSADLNGDGKPDIVAGSQGTSISVAFGNGDGTYQTAFLLTAGSMPVAVAAADLNGDGKPDLIAANYNDDTISVFINKGNGTFKSQVTYPTGYGPVSLAVGNFGNGHMDVAVVDKTGNSISIFLGNGDGTLTFSQTLGTGYYPHSIVAADVNHDGALDLVEVNEGTGTNGSFSIYMGNGNGSFGAPATYMTANASSSYLSPDAVAVGDLNGDGNMDVAVVDSVASVVEVWIGDVSGNMTYSNAYPTGTDPDGVVIADLSGTGAEDVITANWGNADGSSSTASVLMGNGDGTLNAKTDYPMGWAATSIVSVAIAGTSKDDVLVTGPGVGAVNLLAGGYTNTPPVAVNQSATLYQNTVGNSINVLTGDTDADGDTLTVTLVTAPSDGTASISGGKVLYTPIYGYVGSDSFTYTISDGWGGTATATVNVTDGAITTPPVMTTTVADLAYITSTPAKVIDSALTVADTTIPNLDLKQATVSITGNFVTGEDVLSFVNQSGITGSWNAATGVMTLNGVATMALYQAAMRTVKYSDAVVNASVLTRTISFSVNDGASSNQWSTAATRAIDMTLGRAALTGVFGTTWTLPPSVVDGTALTGYASVAVHNIGNIPLPTGQNVNIVVVAHDTTDTNNPDITLVTLNNQSVSALAAGGSATFLPHVSLAAGLPVDVYQIVATITPVQALTESNQANHTVTQTALGATETIVSATPFVDLSAAFGSTLALPATDTSGDGKAMTVPVVVRNLGNVALPSGQKINIEIEAFDGTTTTTLKTLVAQSVSSLAAGASATFTATGVTLPLELASGTYHIVAVADSSSLLTGDTNRANNTVSSVGVITVTYGYVDLTGLLGTTYTLLPSVVDGKAVTGYTSVVVKNIGNVALPAGQNVNIVVVAHDTTVPTNPDITLATLNNQSVSALAAGGSRSFSAYINLASGLPTDTYQILANITPSQPLTEEHTDNNQASLTATGGTETIISASPFVDLSAALGSTFKLAATDISGDGKVITVPVVVRNVGNVALPSGQKINVEIEAFDGTTTTPLKTLTAQSVSSLAAGGSATFTASVTLPIGLATGTYNIIAVADSSDALTGDTDRANNTVTSSGTMAVTMGFVDLSAAFGTTLKLPTSDISGDGKLITVPVVVKNVGNVALPVGQKINIEIDAFDGTTTTLLKTLVAQSVSSLAAGASATFTATGVTLPIGLATGTYNLVAVADSSDLLTGDTNRANNKVTTSGTMAVTQGYGDLSAAFGTTFKLPATDISGDGKLISVPVVVKNVGNVLLPAGQKINIEIDAFNGTTTTVIKTLTAQSVSSLAAGASATFTASVSLPQSLATGTYNIVAVADSSDLVTSDTNRTNNKVTSSGTIVVTQGVANLTGSTFGTLWTLPTTLAAGKALKGYASVVLKNTGNLALPAGQLVNIVIVAHDMTNTNNPDITLATLTNQSVSAVAAGGTRQFNPYINWAAGLPADTYQFRAVITPTNNLAEFSAGSGYPVLTNTLGGTLGITVI